MQAIMRNSSRVALSKSLASAFSSTRAMASHVPEHNTQVGIVQQLKSFKGSNPDVSFQVEEVRIQFSWGDIAGKWWGNQNVRPILALHGWQDNAGTFDSLAPLLPKHIGILALDLPGHGLSSRIPDGMFYSTIDALLLINLIKKEYNWDKVSLMGHSMSAVLGFIYCSMYPDGVDMMIGLDSLKPHVWKPNSLIPRLRRGLDNFMIANERNETKAEPPSYNYEELVERLHKGTNGSLSKSACDLLLKRAITKSSKFPDKFFFHRDTRLKTFNFTSFSREQILEMVECITSTPYLFINATKSPYFEEEKFYLEAKAAMLKRNPKMECHDVEGTHHIHLSEPEKISGIVAEFINRIRPPTSENFKAKL